MAIARTLIETGTDGSGEFQVHAEAGRARGALSTVLVVPRQPAHALADALRALHDPRGAVDLDERLGQLAGAAPPGTGFVVTLESSAWVFPSERVHLERHRDGAAERLFEPQVLGLLPGDKFIVTEAETGEELARLLSIAIPTGAPETAADPEGESEAIAAPAARSSRWSSSSGETWRRPRLVVGGAILLVLVSAAVIRWARPPAAPPRADAFAPPSLEQRVVDLLATNSSRSGPASNRGSGPVRDATASGESPDDAPDGSTRTSESGERTDAAAAASTAPAVSAERASLAPWEFRAAGAITSSPLLLDGKLFFGCRDAHLYCLDAASGDPVWSLPTATGIGSSPRAIGGRVVVGTYGGKILSVWLETGEIAWEASTEGRIVSSPCLTAGRVIVGSYDGQVHAFDAETGARVWSRAAGAAVRASGELVGQDGVVIGAGNGRFLHLAVADGSVRWERTFPTAVHAQATWDAARGCVYVGTQGGQATCLAAETGETRWEVPLGAEVNAQPRLAGESVLFGTGKGALLALDPASGDTRWTARADRGFDARPVVLDALVVAPSFDGTVHLLELASGEVRGRHSIASEVFSSPTAGESLVYVGSMDGTLHALALP